MRLNVDMMGLTDQDWKDLQNLLQAQYEIPDGATRVCLTVVHGELERHVEMPVGSLIGALIGLTLRPVARIAQTVMAALTPDDEDLPADQTCEHGSSVAREIPSRFRGAKSGRIYEDGCHEFGPYRAKDSDK